MPRINLSAILTGRGRNAKDGFLEVPWTHGLGQERPSLNPPLEGTSRRWLPGDIHKMMDSLTLRFDEPLVALLRSDTV